MTSKREDVIRHDVHLMTVKEVEKAYEVDSSGGLTEDEAKRRLAQYGPNQLEDKGGIKFHMILLLHTATFMNAVLLGGTILSLVVKEYVDAAVIGCIIIINILVGFSQESRSEHTLKKLRALSQPFTRVVREGKEVDIPATDVTLGDVVLLNTGDRIPADLRILSVVSLEVDEAMLTGESMPVEKDFEPLSAKETTALGDKINCAFMGCLVTKGRGSGIVVAIGHGTEMGAIATSLASHKGYKTKLQKRMDKLGFFLVISAIVCVGLVLAGGWAHRTFPVYPKGLQVGISTAVAIIPEGLVPIVTLTLTSGVRLLSRKKVIIRRLVAIESLGNVTNICTDKTGTLTEGRMVATHLWVPDQGGTIENGRLLTVTGVALEPVGSFMENDRELDANAVGAIPLLAVLVGSLCNNSSIALKEEEDSKSKEPPNAEWVGAGSPTEVALIVLAHKMKMDKSTLAKEWTLLQEFPFDSKVKRMSVLYEYNRADDESARKDVKGKEKEIPQQLFVFTKGATEVILSLCNEVIEGTPNSPKEFPSHRPLSDQDVRTIHSTVEKLAAEGLRVLCLAYQRTPPSVFSKDSNTRLKAHTRDVVEKELCFVGLVGIADPPRKAVPRSIEICHEAGIVVHMVTGDHRSTALAIARQIGIFPPDLPPEKYDSYVTTAVEFDSSSEKELKTMDLPLVIARCSPESKVRMVQALHARGKYVAMLGDGVNDSPAIKIADVGVAMGKNGSDVTKEAADIIVTDDNFATIVTAVSEGRRIFANIRKFIIHLLSSNVAEVIILVLGVLSSLPPPLSPLQVLWANMVTSTPPALALGTTPASPHLMDKTRRKIDERLWTTEAIVDCFVYGIIMGGLNLACFVISYLALENSLRRSQSVSFVTLTFLLLFQAYNCRVLHSSFLSRNFLRSYYLHVAVLFGVASIFLTLYIPVIETEAFHHERPDWKSWLLILGATLVFIVLSELWKLLKMILRKWKRKKKTNFDIALDNGRSKH